MSAHRDPGDRIADAIFKLADTLEGLPASLDAIARAVRDLGNADAMTPMGAIEMLAKEVRDAGATIHNGLSLLADAVDAE